MKRVLPILVLFMLVFSTLPVAASPLPQSDLNPNPPAEPVKLIFIHHSTGGNWLADSAGNELGGGLGRALMENNYYVSATNYGWGPDSIGDATDIPNWLDWFRSDNSSTYLDALYNETGQNFGDFGSWPRLSSDPGGENQIIVFKSCFPNSELEGSPSDPPDPEGWLSVGHAKYIYNEILQYFATRPDKLFIVITAPPLTASSTSRSSAANARAFNDWLVNDWLAENNYTLPNVAVFDFYNVLTGPDNHHRYSNGEIEHVYAQGMNTEYYPSGDDHPSREGNEKATEEFISLLNIWYNRWAATAPDSAPAGNDNPSAAATAEPTVSSGTSNLSPSEGLLADFDTLTPTINAYVDEAAATRLDCAPASDAAYSGASALKMDFDVAAGSWSTCVLSYDSAQNWSSGQGLAFAIHAAQAGVPYEIVIYAGSPDDRESYIDYATTPTDSVDGWATVEIPWSDFHRVDWEADAGTPFAKTDQALSFGFGFSAADTKTVGTVWVDDVHLLGTEPVTQPPVDTGDTGESDSEAGNPLCPGTAMLSLALLGLVWLLRRR